MSQLEASSHLRLVPELGIRAWQQIDAKVGTGVHLYIVFATSTGSHQGAAGILTRNGAFPLSWDKVMSQIRNANTNTECISVFFFNVCFAYEQMIPRLKKESLKQCRFILSSQEAIDVFGIRFIVSFYIHLRQGRSIEDAYQDACTSVDVVLNSYYSADQTCLNDDHKGNTSDVCSACDSRDSHHSSKHWRLVLEKDLSTADESVQETRQRKRRIR